MSLNEIYVSVSQIWLDYLPLRFAVNRYVIPFVTYKQSFIYSCSCINNSKRVKFLSCNSRQNNFHSTFTLELKREGRWRYVNIIWIFYGHKFTFHLLLFSYHSCLLFDLTSFISLHSPHIIIIGSGLIRTKDHYQIS